MSGPEGIARLLAELAAMSPASRGAILDALSPDERAHLSRASNEARPTPAASSPYSLWLALRIEAAQHGAGIDSMTPATRAALLRSTDSVLAPASDAAASGPHGRSLFDTFGSKLAARMGRP